MAAAAQRMAAGPRTNVTLPLAGGSDAVAAGEGEVAPIITTSARDTSLKPPSQHRLRVGLPRRESDYSGLRVRIYSVLQMSLQFQATRLL